MNKVLLQKLACPYDHNDLVLKTTETDEFLLCNECKRKYEINNNIPNLLPDDIKSITKVFDNKKDNDGQWLPGYRGWKPNIVTRLLSFGLKKGGGRIKEKILPNTNDYSILDVGCGDDYNGDVNVDVYVPNPIPPNFVLASAEKLPFKDSSFVTVRSAYVIEHCLYPVDFIKEEIRVCKEQVKIYTDNSDWLGVFVYRLLNAGSIFHDEHYYKWSKEYLKNILNRLNIIGDVVTLNTSPALLIKIFAMLGRLPRIGTIFQRDLYVYISKDKIYRIKN